MRLVRVACAAGWVALAACGVKAPPRPPLPEAAAPALDGGPDGGAAPAPEWPDAGLPRTTP